MWRAGTTCEVRIFIRAPAFVDQFGMLQELHGFRHPGQIPNARQIAVAPLPIWWRWSGASAPGVKPPTRHAVGGLREGAGVTRSGGYRDCDRGRP